MQQIEFFHNVVCSHCFIMSRRLKEVLEAYPEVEVIHRSFPLNWETSPPQLTDREADHEKLIPKWEMANKIDEPSRFNIEKMKSIRFRMPTSGDAQLAIRAASRLGENPWIWFDLFQEALFEEVRDVSDEAVIFNLVRQTSIDFDEWLKLYNDPLTFELEKSDFSKGSKYDIKLIPAMVINNTIVIEGTKRTDLAQELLKSAFEKTKKIESND